jgi:bla regulator protein BlaR1
MRILEQFASTALAGTLGWALLHSLWEGTVIAALLASAMIGIRSPRTRYVLACAAMVAMFLSFGLTIANLMPEELRDVQVLKASHPFWNTLSNNSSLESSDLSLSTIAPWLGMFWFAGVWFMCVWRAASWMSVQRLRRRGVCTAADRWQEKVAALSAQLQVTRAILFVESCLTEVPIVLGHFRPLILLPVGLLTGMPSDQVEAILLHELAHIQRHDYLLNVLQRLAEAFFFYHPAAWWISNVIRTEREHCCDDIVVAVTGNAHDYSVALAALEEKRISGREAALAATGGDSPGS